MTRKDKFGFRYILQKIKVSVKKNEKLRLIYQFNKVLRNAISLKVITLEKYLKKIYIYLFSKILHWFTSL